MKDYFAIIGYAVVNPQFRQDLLAQGHGAVTSNNLSVTLSALDIQKLNEFMTADPPEKAQAAQGFADAQVGVEAVCQNPPCPYASSFDDGNRSFTGSDKGRQAGRPRSEQRKRTSGKAKGKSKAKSKAKSARAKSRKK